MLEQAYHWGFEDAIAGIDQRGSRYFPLCSPGWDAYNEGYLAGSQMVYSLTGLARYVWLPQEN